MTDLKTKVVLDTNVLIQNPYIIDEYENINIPITVVEELDKLKVKSGDLGYKARKAIKSIESCEDIFIEPKNGFKLPEGWEVNNDNSILAFALSIGAKLITSDYNMVVKAKALGLEVEKYDKHMEDSNYKGYTEVFLDLSTEEGNSELCEFYENPCVNKHNIPVNGYIIIKDSSVPTYNTDKSEENYKTVDIMRWDGDRFVELKLPPKKVISPLNDLQKCTLDLLNNDDIPIKIIAGTYGSGKTMLSTVVGAYKVQEKGLYEKLVFVRNNDTSSGKDPGALPGELSDKVGMLFQTMTQHLPGKEQMADNMRRFGQLEEYITYFIKGLSISGYMIVDESEDLTLKNIKTVGSRIEKGCVVFCGDWKQAEGRYQSDNGLSYLINHTKNEKLCGAVVLDVDVRSDASKVFADL